MAEPLRFLPVGSDGLLVELDHLQTTLTLLDALQGDRPDGVVELIPAARTLMVRFNTHVTNSASLVETIAHIDLSAKSSPLGEVFEIPVTYDGEDLNDVAELLGLSVEDLIRRHTEATYIVAFTGFAPGFAYMPRMTPCSTCRVERARAFAYQRARSRSAANSVAFIRATALAVGNFLVERNSGCGTRIALGQPFSRRVTACTSATPRRGRVCPSLQCRLFLKPASTLQKIPKDPCYPSRPPCLLPGSWSIGSCRPRRIQSGALDRRSLVEANLCVGNPRGSAAIEIAYGGFAMRAERPMTLAVTGAPSQTTIRTSDGRSLTLRIGQPFALNAGDELMLEYPGEGTRSYVAVRGGFTVEKVLGSAATDTLAKVGPAPIVAGDILMPANEAISAVAPDLPCAGKLPKAGDTVTLDITLGPRTDWFSSRSLTTLLAQEWQVTPESSRIGIRLAGQVPLQRADATELPSEGTLLGAIRFPTTVSLFCFLRTIR